MKEDQQILSRMAPQALTQGSHQRCYCQLRSSCYRWHGRVMGLLALVPFFFTLLLTARVLSPRPSTLSHGTRCSTVRATAELPSVCRLDLLPALLSAGVRTRRAPSSRCILV